jgi:hypothetical protein
VIHDTQGRRKKKGMKLTVRQIAVERLYEALRSLGYRPMKMDGRRSQWRRGGFHLYTFPWAKGGVKLSLHKDVWNQSAPFFQHKAEYWGDDVEQELQRIKEKLL